jgi:hypothetical protein
MTRAHVEQANEAAAVTGQRVAMARESVTLANESVMLTNECDITTRRDVSMAWRCVIEAY